MNIVNKIRIKPILYRLPRITSVSHELTLGKVRFFKFTSNIDIAETCGAIIYYSVIDYTISKKNLRILHNKFSFYLKH